MKRAATLVVALILALTLAPAAGWAASGGMRSALQKAGGWQYTVKPGDTLFLMAKRFGTSVEAIRNANGLKGSYLKAGQVVTIPTTGSSRGGNNQGRSNTAWRSRPVSRGDASGRSGIPARFTQEDLYWLARIIYAESRGEPFEGQVGVGAVILNRLDNPAYPKTIKNIIFEKWDGKYYQFSPVADGSIWLEPNGVAFEAARQAMWGYDPSYGALYFYEPSKSTNKWIFTRPVITKIGRHIFTG